MRHPKSKPVFDFQSAGWRVSYGKGFELMQVHGSREDCQELCDEINQRLDSQKKT